MNEDQQNQQEKDQKNNHRFENRHLYGRVYPGIWLIVFGFIFLLNNFGYLPWNVWGKLWPIFIIIPGIFMLLRSKN